MPYDDLIGKTTKGKNMQNNVNIFGKSSTVKMNAQQERHNEQGIPSWTDREM